MGPVGGNQITVHKVIHRKCGKAHSGLFDYALESDLAWRVFSSRASEYLLASSDPLPYNAPLSTARPYFLLV